MSIGSGLLSHAIPVHEHLARQGGVSGEVADLRRDILSAVAPLAGIAVEEILGAVATSATALLGATAMAQSAATFTPSSTTPLLAGGLAGLAAAPRNVSFTPGGTTANVPHTAVITGFDVNGHTLTETVTLATNGSAVTSVNCFLRVTSIAFSAATGSGATVSIGLGTKIGLSRKVKLRNGNPVLLGVVLGKTRVDLTPPDGAALTLQHFNTPSAADNDAFVTASVGVFSTSAVVPIAATSFDGVVGAAALRVPRQVVLTATSTSGAVAGNYLLEGIDVYGNVVNETLAVVDDGAATSVNFFKQLTKVTLPKQTGTIAGTVIVGTGTALGLCCYGVAMGGAATVAPIQELSAGSAVTNGTLVLPASAPPNGSYTPNAAADGSKSYSLVYPHQSAGTLEGPSTAGPYGAYNPTLVPDGNRRYVLFYEFDGAAG